VAEDYVVACLFRRSNGFWYIIYADRERRRWLSTGTRCFGEAHSIFRNRPQERRRNNLIRISDFAAEFQEYSYVNYSSGTLNLYRQSFASLISCIGDKSLKFISVRDVEYFKAQRAQQVSIVSVNIAFRTLKSAFNIACKWGIIQENVFRQSKQIRVPLHEPVYLTREQFRLLLTFVDEEVFHEVIVFAVSTMMRRGEIINLMWDDIDFSRKVIHVRNKKEFTVKGKHPRTIPMSEQIYRILLKRRKPSGYLFVGKNGQKLNPGCVSRRFKRYIRACGLSEQVHFHSLRHTGASWLIQEQVHLYTVQKILGHTSPIVTQIYSHLSDDNLREAIEQIDAF